MEIYLAAVCIQFWKILSQGISILCVVAKADLSWYICKTLNNLG